MKKLVLTGMTLATMAVALSSYTVVHADEYSTGVLELGCETSDGVGLDDTHFEVYRIAKRDSSVNELYPIIEDFRYDLDEALRNPDYFEQNKYSIYFEVASHGIDYTEAITDGTGWAYVKGLEYGVYLVKMSKYAYNNDYTIPEEYYIVELSDTSSKEAICREVDIPIIEDSSDNTDSSSESSDDSSENTDKSSNSTDSSSEYTDDSSENIDSSSERADTSSDSTDSSSESIDSSSNSTGSESDSSSNESSNTQSSEGTTSSTSAGTGGNTTGNTGITNTASTAGTTTSNDNPETGSALKVISGIGVFMSCTMIVVNRKSRSL